MIDCDPQYNLFLLFFTIQPILVILFPGVIKKDVFSLEIWVNVPGKWWWYGAGRVVV